MTWQKITNAFIAQRVSDEEAEGEGATKVISIRTGKPLGYEGFRGLGVSFNLNLPESIRSQLDSVPEVALTSSRNFDDIQDSHWLSHTVNSTCRVHRTQHANCGPDTIDENGKVKGGCRSAEIQHARELHKDPDISENKKIAAWERARHSVVNCHQGREDNLIENCSCGVYTHLNLKDTIAYNRGTSTALPVRLLMSGPLWRGAAGVRAAQATLTGIFLPSSLEKEKFGGLGSGIRDEDAQKLQKFYNIPLLDARTPTQWPTSAQVLHKLVLSR